jgi:radical SAM protein with 4Fe4S-binding SPASM domain
MRNLATLARDVGVDYLVLKPYSQSTFSLVQRQIDYTQMRELESLPDEFNTDKFQVIYRANAVDQESRPMQYEKCNATPFMWAYTMANGDLFTCSAHLLDKRFCIGNINTHTFRELWEGEGRRENWRMMKQEFDIKDCRLNCRMNQTNIHLDRVLNGVPHGNFL